MRTIEGRVSQICVDLENAFTCFFSMTTANNVALYSERCKQIFRNALREMQEDCVLSALDALDNRVLHKSVAEAIREIK